MISGGSRAGFHDVLVHRPRALDCRKKLQDVDARLQHLATKAAAMGAAEVEYNRLQESLNQVNNHISLTEVYTHMHTLNSHVHTHTYAHAYHICIEHNNERESHVG